MKAYEPRLMGNLTSEAARRWGDREALVFGDRRWTHAQFGAEVDLTAKALIAAGVKSGEKVGIWMTNRPEWLFLMYAIPAVGGVTVPLNTRYRAEDVQYTVDQSDTSTLIFNDRSGPIDYSAMVRQVADQWPKVERMIALGDDRPDGAMGWDEFRSAADSVSDETLAERRAGVRADEPMIIIYTSGTTSLPKGAVHNHAVIRNVAERAQMHGVSPNDVHAGYLPLFHAFGYTEVALFTVLTGSKMVLFETFDADEILDAAAAEGITLFHGFDTHWGDFLRANGTRPWSLSVRFGTLAAGQESTTPIAKSAGRAVSHGLGMGHERGVDGVRRQPHVQQRRTTNRGVGLRDGRRGVARHQPRDRRGLQPERTR